MKIIFPNSSSGGRKLWFLQWILFAEWIGSFLLHLPTQISKEERLEKEMVDMAN